MKRDRWVKVASQAGKQLAAKKGTSSGRRYRTWQETQAGSDPSLDRSEGPISGHPDGRHSDPPMKTAPPLLLPEGRFLSESLQEFTNLGGPNVTPQRRPRSAGRNDVCQYLLLRTGPTASRSGKRTRRPLEVQAAVYLSLPVVVILKPRWGDDLPPKRLGAASKGPAPLLRAASLTPFAPRPAPPRAADR